MSSEPVATLDSVGPVLQRGEGADVVIAAIQELNLDVVLVDRGAYVRVLVPNRCVVTRKAIEAHLGRAFLLPGDLEPIMPAFKGRFRVDDDQAIWEFQTRRADR